MASNSVVNSTSDQLLICDMCSIVRNRRYKAYIECETLIGISNSTKGVVLSKCSNIHN